MKIPIIVRHKIKKYIITIYEALPNEYKNKILNTFASQDIKQQLIDNILQLCTPTTDREMQKKIFKKNVRLMEIEAASFCNRTCWFCPNSYIDRKSSSIQLSEQTYLKILNDLAEIDYSNQVNFHRYNEPLANKEFILKRIKITKEYLPNARLVIFSNGDYLDEQYVKDLQEAGVDEMLISYYFGKNVEFDVEKIIKPAIEKMSKKINLPYKEYINTAQEYRVLFEYKNLNIIYGSWNPKYVGQSRGNSMENEIKDTAYRLHKEKDMQTGCFQNSMAMHIDYNGLVMPCCNTRSDVKSHNEFILGNVNESSIFDIFCGEKNALLRQQLMTSSLNHHICKGCNDRRLESFLLGK